MRLFGVGGADPYTQSSTEFDCAAVWKGDGSGIMMMLDSNCAESNAGVLCNTGPRY